jgi:hypothetical protein
VINGSEPDVEKALEVIRILLHAGPLPGMQGVARA